MLWFAYLIVLDIIRGEILHNLVIIVCCGGAVTKETDFVDCISLHCPIHQHCRCRFCLVNVLLCPTNRIIANHYIAVSPQLLVLDRAPCLDHQCSWSLLFLFANVGNTVPIKLRPFYETYQQIYRIFFFVSIAVYNHRLLFLEMTFIQEWIKWSFMASKSDHNKVH